jgi:predicted DNA-binding protein (UPF0251 family)
MPRPRKNRRVCVNPSVLYFKPRGIPIFELEEVVLEHDELESLRLADLLAYSHERSALEMNISRATFGRIVEKARKKVVDGIINGKAIRINGLERASNVTQPTNGVNNENCSSNK